MACTSLRFMMRRGGAAVFHFLFDAAFVGEHQRYALFQEGDDFCWRSFGAMMPRKLTTGVVNVYAFFFEGGTLGQEVMPL